MTNIPVCGMLVPKPVCEREREKERERQPAPPPSPSTPRTANGVLGAEGEAGEVLCLSLLLGVQPRVKSLRSSYTELYPQTPDLCLAAPIPDRRSDGASLKGSYTKIFSIFKKSGNEVYYPASFLLVILNNSCSKLHCQKFFKLKSFSYNIGNGMESVHRVSSSLLGPVDPSFRALSGRLKYTVRCHKVEASRRKGLSRRGKPQSVYPLDRSRFGLTSV